MKRFLIKTIATGLGSGLAPIVPGTFGTIPGVVIAWFLFPLGWPYQVVPTIIMLAVGVWAATQAESYFGHDGKPIVIDEIAGIMVGLCFVPVVWQYYALGFVIFRILDIIKPFPARQWEDLPRGWGVMGDDFAVGVYTNLLLQILIYFKVWL
jgi:phosphatidylglycerophosphatase A